MKKKNLLAGVVLLTAFASVGCMNKFTEEDKAEVAKVIELDADGAKEDSSSKTYSYYQSQVARAHAILKNLEKLKGDKIGDKEFKILYTDYILNTRNLEKVYKAIVNSEAHDEYDPYNKASEADLKDINKIISENEDILKDLEERFGIKLDKKKKGELERYNKMITKYNQIILSPTKYEYFSYFDDMSYMIETEKKGDVTYSYSIADIEVGPNKKDKALVLVRDVPGDVRFNIIYFDVDNSQVEQVKVML